MSTTDPIARFPNSTGNTGLDILADAIAARVAARLCQPEGPRLLKRKQQRTSAAPKKLCDT
jgi:hypothetical protein